MDPRGKQYNKTICLTDAVAVLDDWLARGHMFYWSRTPKEVVTDLVIETAQGPLKYGRAVEILRTARTEKMPGHANRGLQFIQDEWKKL